MFSAFNYPVFVDEIKTWYEDAVGDAPRGDGSLNEYQLKVFIGRLLKEAYRGGLMPKAAFFSDGAMSDVDIENIIERRCATCLKDVSIILPLPPELATCFTVTCRHDGKKWQSSFGMTSSQSSSPFTRRCGIKNALLCVLSNPVGVSPPCELFG
jgi:hypothetical protein